ncbi:hydroxyacid dehydrogenase, partial [bacterium (Candidatus Howlettbacteria) CG23_combo_of_CG06-09_8_20_14_all_37_9]
SFYKELISHPKIIATPHISFHTETTIKTANDIMIDNVEAWINGNPINIVN